MQARINRSVPRHAETRRDTQRYAEIRRDTQSKIEACEAMGHVIAWDSILSALNCPLSIVELKLKHIVKTGLKRNGKEQCLSHLFKSVS